MDAKSPAMQPYKGPSLPLGDPGPSPLSPTANIPPLRDPRIASPNTERRTIKTRSSSRTLPTLEPVMESESKSPKGSIKAMVTKKKSRELLKSNSQYFHASLHERRGDVAGDIVRGEAMVMAELKTNIKACAPPCTLYSIEDEFAFIADLSQHLAKRYTRPAESIIVILDHGKCMLFGGTMDPAYVLSISALPVEVQQATNKRNTAVMQRYMETALGVPSTRGFIRFIPVGEECAGWGGKTVFGRIGDATGRASTEADPGRTHDRRMLGPLSLRKSALIEETTPPTTPSKKDSVHRSSTSSSRPAGKVEGGAPNGRPLRKRKSFMATFFRSAKYESDIPTIPQEVGT